MSFVLASVVCPRFLYLQFFFSHSLIILLWATNWLFLTLGVQNSQAVSFQFGPLTLFQLYPFPLLYPRCTSHPFITCMPLKHSCCLFSFCCVFHQLPWCTALQSPPSLSLPHIYEACTTKTYLRMLMNVLQLLKEIATGIRARVLLVQKSWLWAAAWSIVPQLFAHCHWTWSYSCQWLPLMWHSHGDKSGLYAGCLNTSYCMVFTISCTLWATWGWK
jgi:hypothetical protein